MRHIAVLSLLPIIACARAPAAADADLRPPVVRLAPDTARYRVVERRRVEQVVHQRTLVTELRTTFLLTVALGPADDGFTARFALDSVEIEGGTGSDAALARTSRGATFVARLRSDGAVEEVEVQGDTNPLLVRLRSALWSFLPRLPADGAREGVTWSDTTEHPTRAADVALTVEGRNDHAVGAWAERAGGPALPITTESAYVVDGTGRQSGQEVIVEGTGHRRTVRYLDAGGRYLGGTALDSATIEVRLTAAGVTVPVRQWTADTVETRR